jgi:RNA recognition motif-containing protein
VRVISATIFIGNLSYEATEDELRELLSAVDAGVRVRLGMDRMTGKARGFAFAQFASDALAADAVRRFDGAELRGRRIRVNDADDKPPPRAPRPEGGGPSRFPGSGGPSRFAGGGRPNGPGGGAPAPRAPMEFMPPPEDGGGDFKGFRKGGGSRRGLRARKRSLRY